MGSENTLRIILEGQYAAAYEMLDDAVSVGLTPVLIGPPGVGKSLLARKFAADRGRPFYEVFFDELMRSGYLIGSFDPAVVIQKGYCREAFEEGPLIRSMREGAVFLAQDINRASEFTQNSLLEPLEERSYYVPRLERVHAHEGFVLIATSNPAELAGTHRISEALRDRLHVWIPLTYPEKETELKIISLHCEQVLLAPDLLEKVYSLIKAVRDDKELGLSVSVRAGISLAKLVSRHVSREGILGQEEFMVLAGSVFLGSSLDAEWMATRQALERLMKNVLEDHA